MKDEPVESDARPPAEVPPVATTAPVPEPDVIVTLFTYHAPTESQRLKYETIREVAKDLVRVIDTCCPPGPDRTAAVRKIREAVMTANASIATNNVQYR